MNVLQSTVNKGFVRRRKMINVLMLGLSFISIFVIITPLLWILVYVFKEGLPALSKDFFTQLPTPVGVPGGGIANSLVGSLITIVLALTVSLPVGLLTGFYAAQRSNTTLGLAIRFATDVIAGVPSIVMGIFAYTIIVLPQRHFSAFSGGIVLSFIMLPIIIRTTEVMIRLVPRTLNEGSLALGASEWKTQLSVILPAAANGVITGVMLAIARAAGEAAPMLFTAFGNPFMNLDINQPIATLPHTIFVYAISPYQDWHAKAWATAAVLIFLVFVLNISARLFAWRREKQLGSISS